MLNYVTKYQIAFKAASPNEPTYIARIKEKDYTGLATSLTGVSVTQQYQIGGEHPILTPIRSTTVTLQYVNNNIVPIRSFYSNDDDKFCLELFCQTTNEIVFVGLLQQDDSSEDLAAPPYIVSLKFNDNIALLKELKPGTIDFTNPLQQVSKFFETCIKATGVEIPLVSWLNTFETTMPNKVADPLNDPLQFTYLNKNFFVNDSGEALFLYECLEKILRGVNACMFQAGGKWHVVNMLEFVNYRGSALGVFTGVEYQWLSGELYPTQSLQHPLAIAPNLNDGQTEVYTINANAQRAIIRPYKSVKHTFKYNYRNLIINRTLNNIGTGVTVEVVNNIRKEIYAFPTNSGWQMINLVATPTPGVVLYKTTNVVTNVEVERWIHIPSKDPVNGSVGLAGFRFNPIDVNAGDVIDWAFKYRRTDSASGSKTFGLRIVVVPYGQVQPWRQLVFTGTSATPNNIWRWNEINRSYPDYSGAGSLNISSLIFNDTGDDRPNWQTADPSLWSLDELPPIVESGLLYFEIYGFNHSQFNDVPTDIKDIEFSIVKTQLNGSTAIVGQTHTDTNNAAPKQVLEIDVFTDDTERRSLQGTLLLSNGTPTNLWQMPQQANNKRLGQWRVEQLQKLFRTPRTKVTADLKNIVWNGRNLTAIEAWLLQDDTFQTGIRKWFMLAECTIDYVNGTISNATFYELFDENENAQIPVILVYDFNYLYK